MSTNFTQLAENRMNVFTSKFRHLPREFALRQFHEIKKDKGKSNYRSAMSDLLKDCGFNATEWNERKINETQIQRMIESLDSENEMAGKMLEEIYAIYNEYKTPGEYMERIVRHCGVEFKNDSVRVAILKQIVRNIQNDMTSDHKGVANIIECVKKRAEAQGHYICSVNDVVNNIDESIFYNISDAIVPRPEDVVYYSKLHDIINGIDEKFLYRKERETLDDIKAVVSALKEGNAVKKKQLEKLSEIKTFFSDVDCLKEINEALEQIFYKYGDAILDNQKREIVDSVIKLQEDSIEKLTKENKELLCRFARMFMVDGVQSTNILMPVNNIIKNMGKLYSICKKVEVNDNLKDLLKQIDSKIVTISRELNNKNIRIDKAQYSRFEKLRKEINNMGKSKLVGVKKKLLDEIEIMLSLILITGEIEQSQLNSIRQKKYIDVMHSICKNNEVSEKFEELLKQFAEEIKKIETLLEGKNMRVSEEHYAYLKDIRGELVSINASEIEESDRNLLFETINVLGRLTNNEVTTREQLVGLKKIKSIFVQDDAIIKVNELLHQIFANDEFHPEQKNIIKKARELSKKELTSVDDETKKMLYEFTLFFTNRTKSERDLFETVSYIKFKPEQENILLQVANIILENKINISRKNNSLIEFIEDEVKRRKEEEGRYTKEFVDNCRRLLTYLVTVNNEYKGIYVEANKYVFSLIPLDSNAIESINKIYNICKRKTLGSGEAKLIATIDYNIREMIGANLKKELSQEGRDLLKTADDLANCIYRPQGSTRKDMYLFAFAFGLRWYENKEGNGYNKYVDLEKFFVDTYNDCVFRYMGKHRNRKHNAIPTGEGVNFKNFAETICVYYLSKEDEKLTHYDRYVSAMNCIEKCRENSKEIKKETQKTQIYKNNYMDVIKNIKTDDKLVEHITNNYYIPKNTQSNVILERTVDVDLLKKITGQSITEESVKIAVMKKFIENAFVGNSQITGVKTFRDKLCKLRIGGITTEAELLEKLTEGIVKDYIESESVGDKHTKLVKLVEHLASGNFGSRGIARESLYKFAFVFNMKPYKDSDGESENGNKDIEKTLLIPFLGEGIDYESKVDTVFAYYMLKDGIEPTGETKTAIGQKMKKAYDVLGKNKHGLIRNSIADPKTYFWETVVNMSEEEFARYLEENFEDVEGEYGVNDYYLEADQITALEVYNELLNETKKLNDEISSKTEDCEKISIDMEEFSKEIGYKFAEYNTEADAEILLEIQEDMLLLERIMEKNTTIKDEKFNEILRAMVTMLDSGKKITGKNITRVSLIAASYYEIVRSLNYMLSLNESYAEITESIDQNLIKARYNPLDSRNMFDVFVVFLVYMRVMLYYNPQILK